MGGGPDLPHHVEDGIVLQRVADLLQLFKQALQNAALDGVGRDKVEDQAVLALAVAVDTSPSAAPGGSGSTGYRS